MAVLMENSSFKEFIKLFKVLKFPDYVSCDAQDLITKLLNVDDEMRLGMGDNGTYSDCTSFVSTYFDSTYSSSLIAISTLFLTIRIERHPVTFILLQHRLGSIGGETGGSALQARLFIPPHISSVYHISRSRVRLERYE